MKEINDGKASEDTKPEPKEDIDFLIEDVDWQDTLGIMALYAPTWSIFMKSALSDPWEDPGHGVCSVLRLLL